MRGGVGIEYSLVAARTLPWRTRVRDQLPRHGAALNLSFVPAKASSKPGGNAVDTAQPTAVALDDATVAFRLADARVYTAVEQARLSVAHGEFVAIVGPTGCGKSTLLNVAAGLLKPAAGSVGIFDQPLTGLNRDAGYLFQADAPFPWTTGR